MEYKDAGVDIQEGYRAIDKYRELVLGTRTAGVIDGIGSFGGLFSLKDIISAGAGMEDPVLVCGTDGVGTKLDIAFRLKKYDTVGIDCVAMCANDILCHGATPLFFLDYLACGKLDASIASELVKGIAVGCRETGMALLGGETAEMPGFYEPGKYDIAGFAVGIADRPKLVDGSAIVPGDTIIGVASSGVHSNGFSLIRACIPDLHEDFGGMPLGYALLEPTRLYVKPMLPLISQGLIKGMAHITGGGFAENIPRMFPQSPEGAASFDAAISAGWAIPPLFARIAAGVAGSPETGAAAQAFGAEAIRSNATLRNQLFSTFNMGIGFVIAADPKNCERILAYLAERDYPAWVIGRVEAAQGASGAVRFV